MTDAEPTVPPPPVSAPPAWDPPSVPAPGVASPRVERIEPLTAAATAVLGGFLVGVVTQALQGELPGNWSVLANSGVMWSLAAAAVGVLMPSARAAVAGGAASMVVASISYYWAVDWFEGIASDARSTVIWSAVGVVAGAAFGLVGWLVRHDADRRWLALALVAGLVLGEGRHLVTTVDWLRPAGLVQVVSGVALAAVCVRRDRRPHVAIALVAVAAVAYAVAGRLVDAAFLLPA
jgi:hypothetical protein